MKKKHKKLIGIAIITAVIFVVIRYATTVYNLNKSLKNYTKLGSELKLSLTKKDAKNLCARVIVDCNWFSSDSDVYLKLLSLKDVDLQLVTNVWSTVYYEQNEGLSLAEYIIDNKVVVSDDIQKLTERLNLITKQ